MGQDLEGREPRSHFGSVVALSADGTIVAVGLAENDENGDVLGKVKVFQFEESSWMMLGTEVTVFAGSELEIALTLASDGLTFAVVYNSFTTNTAHIMSAYRYVEAVGWMQLGESIVLDTGVYGGLARSLSISGNGEIVAAGTNGVDEAGSVYVYALTSDNEWHQLGKNIQGAEAGDQLGSSVCLSADAQTLAVGAPQFENGGPGYVRTFRFSASADDWIQLGTNNLKGDILDERFGLALSLSDDGNRLVIGSDPELGYMHVYSIDTQCLVNGAPTSVQSPSPSTTETSVPSGFPSPTLQSTGRPTDFPTEGPTFMPAPVPIVASTFLPTNSTLPSPSPTESPSINYSAPAHIPVFGSVPSPSVASAPFRIPANFPGQAPISAPVSVAPITDNLPSSNPVSESAPTPVLGPGILRRAYFEGITMEFRGVSALGEVDIIDFETEYKSWYDDFFANEGGRAGVRDMATTMLFLGQNTTANRTSISFSQKLVYRELEDASQPEVLVVWPFSYVLAKEDLAARLVGNIEAFQGMELPIDPPVFVSEAENLDDAVSTDKSPSPSKNISPGAIAGIVVGVLAAAILLVGVGCCFKNRRTSREPVLDKEPLRSVTTFPISFIEVSNDDNRQAEMDLSADVETVVAVEVLSDSTAGLPHYKDQVRGRVRSSDDVKMLPVADTIPHHHEPEAQCQLPTNKDQARSAVRSTHNVTSENAVDPFDPSEPVLHFADGLSDPWENDRAEGQGVGEQDDLGFPVIWEDF